MSAYGAQSHRDQGHADKVSGRPRPAPSLHSFRVCLAAVGLAEARHTAILAPVSNFPTRGFGEEWLSSETGSWAISRSQSGRGVLRTLGP